MSENVSSLDKSNSKKNIRISKKTSSSTSKRRTKTVTDNDNPLHEKLITSIFNNDHKEIEFLLIVMDELNFRHDNYTPLTAAIQMGNISLISELLKRCDSTYRDGRNLPPAYHAIKSGDKQIINLFIKDIKIEDRVGPDIPILMFMGMNLNAAKIITSTFSSLDLNTIKDSSGANILHYAVQVQKNVNAIKFLSKRVDINSKDEGGNTVLHKAVMVKNNCENIKYLCKVINVNIRNNKGFDAIEISDEFDHIKNCVPIYMCKKYDKSKLDDKIKETIALGITGVL